MPDSLPITEEHAERLREQANQLPEPTVLRLIDLLAVAIDDERQGGDPRLPLELALVKVTRPHADLSRESLAHRVELLESRVHPGASLHPVEPRAEVPPSASPPLSTPVSSPPSDTAAGAPSAAAAEAPVADGHDGEAATDDAPAAPPSPEAGSAPPSSSLTLEQVRDSWTRSIVPAMRERSIPTATLLEGATRPRSPTTRSR